jgi:hypothetical protein
MTSDQLQVVSTLSKVFVFTHKIERITLRRMNVALVVRVGSDEGNARHDIGSEGTSLTEQMVVTERPR